MSRVWKLGTLREVCRVRRSNTAPRLIFLLLVQLLEAGEGSEGTQLPVPSLPVGSEIKPLEAAALLRQTEDGSGAGLDIETPAH